MRLLVICSRFVSQGMSMQVLAWTFHIGLTTVHKIIYEMCMVLWDTLNPLYLKSLSTKQDWLHIVNGFKTRWNFPHCLGALDGKHVTIQAPAKSGSLFFNYKKQFSIVLLAVCDSQYRFTLVDIGPYGSQSDGGIFKESVFGTRFEQQEFNILDPEVLDETSNIEMPYFLVADEAFPLRQYIIRPYGGEKI
ncbi:uncharacterized protein LOC126891256 [Diabrotica virgifera virgifera]|uniref:DDE Tnp4 domain-containing protein n=1 Tax=Diabrotica virgifera virgifera TaxID=50390 RepID=A0ABM5L1S8_DIAVI|nr:uncharacterized protein LOC126891256 [Diabrotica virgifera virgifera]